jgi:hypothetical protein
MRYEYKSSFEKVFKKLGSNRQEEVINAISILMDFFENRKKAKGLAFYSYKCVGYLSKPRAFSRV